MPHAFEQYRAWAVDAVCGARAELFDQRPYADNLMYAKRASEPPERACKRCLSKLARQQQEIAAIRGMVESG